MAAQTTLELATPLQRLNALPTAVNWRGVWNEDIEFYKNDIVISPITSGSFINISASSATRGQGDPSTNPADWYIFGEGAPGVQEIQGSEYITVGPTTTPEITNNGVREMAIGQNLNNLGTQNDPILEDLGITNIIPVSPGITYDGDTLSNSGLIYLSAGNSGITVDGTTEVSLACAGILSMTALNPTITVGAGLTPLITNNGLLSVTALSGLTNTGTPQEPDLVNDGVIDISSNSMAVTGFPNVKLSATHPFISLVGTLVDVIPVISPGVNSVIYTVPLTQDPGTLWASCLGSGTPYSTGTFTLQFSFTFNLETPSSLNIGDTKYTIVDSINNVTYTPPNQVVNQTAYNRANLPSTPPFNLIISVRVLKIILDLATLRASGFRQITGIQLTQIAAIGQVVNLTLLSENTNVFATYNSQSSII